MCDASFLSGNRTKAGLPEDNGRERSKIDEMIKEASLGSKYHQYQERHEQKITEKIAKLKSRMESLKDVFERDDSIYRKTLFNLDQWHFSEETTRDLSQCFVHIDMDAFFAAVETLDNPEWASIPMAVGGESMLCTANYEARKYGVVSAMPGYIARKLCPTLLIVPLNYEKYRQAATKFHPIFQKYDPHFTYFSLDEANLNITEHLRLNPQTDPEGLVSEIRSKVLSTTGLTCSAGIASNKMLAKICSNIKKPNGQFYLWPNLEVILKFMEKMSLQRLPGVGKVTAKILKGLLSCESCKDLWENRVWVKLLLSEIQANFLLKACLGIGSTSHNDHDYSNKQSISVERTFKTIKDVPAMLEALKGLAKELASQLDDENLAGKTVSIKMKTADFNVSTRSITLKRWVSSEQDLYHHASQLLKKNQPSNLRLLGVRLSTLTDQEDFGKDGEDLANYLVTYDNNAIKCPVCLLPISADSKDELRINAHLDECLTKESLKHADFVKPAHSHHVVKKAKTLNDFFHKTKQ